MADRPRLVGINHVALEVGDVEEALEFYGRLFAFEVEGRTADQAFLEMGDQFVALNAGRRQPPDEVRHFGLVVDDKDAARRALEAAGVALPAGPRLRFRDPWGNQIELVDYRDIVFTKAPAVLRGMGLDGLAKRKDALRERAAKGLGGPGA